ncbi:hypothetical protein [Paucibacter sp. Y2R2-4]|uniref:hypothetical protein n=1 Tax=Paucibacter sp. Y2R2-4 TaxID=2893553 RepID=UPI0021E3725F|nr:hypothetical protein [Paucibacter sp. Y2R2-4]MCV2350958.1 hypothetical protein [Paucibacter sp. Y2R2-4]
MWHAKHLPFAPRRAFLFSLAGVACSGVWAQAGGNKSAGLPAKNLWIELRWVDSSVSAAVVAGVREGAVVIGTSGSVSPRGGASLSTQRRDEHGGQVQRLLVLNGNAASVQFTENVPMQWVDFGIQVEAQPGAPISGPPAGKVIAVPRSGFTEQTQGFNVTPQWPGGQAPVRLEVRVQSPTQSSGQASNYGSTQAHGGQGAAGTAQTTVLSTVSAPLGEWVTVARSGASVQARERGVLSTRDAETQRSRELQIRVDLAP